MALLLLSRKMTEIRQFWYVWHFAKFKDRKVKFNFATHHSKSYLGADFSEPNTLILRSELPKIGSFENS